MRRIIAASVIAGLVSAYACAAFAEDQERTQDQTQGRTQTHDRIYGSQLMTPQERSEYQHKMRNAKTAEEREQIRQQHHIEMQKRAKEKGMTLPDAPQPGKGGMGPAGGQGPGKGGGQGAGAGKGGGQGGNGAGKGGS